ncbi:MAG TPA: hypothetical protein VFN78_06005 [Ktedonobacterales bacterium]|nr:hypothetical protein [Ktedonobacterales bacterium]
MIADNDHRSEADVSSVAPPSAQRSSTRLAGRWLLAARIVWLLTLVVTLSAFMTTAGAYLTGDARPNTLSAALTPGAVAALAKIGLSVSAFNWIAFAILCIVTLVSLGLALALAWRRSDDWMALLVSLFLVNFIISNIGIPTTDTVSSSLSLLSIARVIVQVLPFIITFAVFLLFPDGQFAPRWSWIILAALTIWVLALTVQPKLFGGALYVGYPLFVGATIACIVYRYRRASTATQRQQTKWVVVGLIASLVANQAFWLPIGFPPLGQTLYAPIGYLLYQAVLLLTPVTFFIAIQRYRLYDIDAIINRALVYGSLTAILVGVYALGVIGTQALVDRVTNNIGAQQPIVIVATTLLVAALFRPLRNRLQATVDRRFYRSKYDAARTVAAFSANLRQDVDLATLQDHLLDAVQRTMQPTHAFVWLRKAPPRTSEGGSTEPARL